MKNPKIKIDIETTITNILDFVSKKNKKRLDNYYGFIKKHIDSKKELDRMIALPTDLVQEGIEEALKVCLVIESRIR
ncbi:hypothetical protein ACFL56_03115 [Candidatus Margulisiibacteriota bacterium]